MYVVVLRPASGRARAGEFIEGHKAWLEQGLSDGVFLLWGGLRPDGGGAIIARGTDRAGLEQRVAADPFVRGGVVAVDILEIAPARAAAPLEFLLERS